MEKSVLVLCTLLCAGCATIKLDAPVVQNVSQLPSIQTIYAARLAKLKTGMPLTDFQKVFPDAYRLYTDDGRRLPIYEIVYMTHYLTRRDVLEGMLSQGQGAVASAYFQALRFHFKDGRLTRWEQPKAWPSTPDAN